MSKITQRYCKNCKETTAHTMVRKSGLGDESESTSDRIISAVFTLGMSEVFSSHYLECKQCGAKKR